MFSILSVIKVDHYVNVCRSIDRSTLCHESTLYTILHTTVPISAHVVSLCIPQCMSSRMSSRRESSLVTCLYTLHPLWSYYLASSDCLTTSGDTNNPCSTTASYLVAIPTTVYPLIKVHLTPCDTNYYFVILPSIL